MDNYYQPEYEKLKKYEKIAESLKDELQILENWLKEAKERKDRIDIEISSKSIEKTKLLLEAVELAIHDINKFLKERVAEEEYN